ncbi:hypothetical protein D3C81_2062090 [compost metagenome]
MSKVPVVFHQADGIVVGARSVKLGTTQSIFISDPALNNRLINADVGRDFFLDVGRVHEYAIQLFGAF